MTSHSARHYLHSLASETSCHEKVHYISFRGREEQHIEWCEEHGDDDWQKLLFCDEATFQLYRNTLSLGTTVDSWLVVLTQA